MFVNYENLQKNLIEEMRKICNFLGYVLTPDMGKCVKERQEGLFHRKKTLIDQTKYYNAEQKVVIKAMKEEIFKKLGIKITK